MFKLPLGLRDALQPLVSAVSGNGRRTVESTLPTHVVRKAQAVPLQVPSDHLDGTSLQADIDAQQRMDRRHRAVDTKGTSWDPNQGRYRPAESKQAFTHFSVDPMLAGGSLAGAAATRSADVLVIDAFVRRVDTPDCDVVEAGSLGSDPESFESTNSVAPGDVADVFDIDDVPVTAAVEANSGDGASSIGISETERIRAAVAESMTRSIESSAAHSEDIGGMLEDLFAIESRGDRRTEIKPNATQVTQDGFDLGLEID